MNSDMPTSPDHPDWLHEVLANIVDLLRQQRRTNEFNERRWEQHLALDQERWSATHRLLDHILTRLGGAPGA